VGGPWHLDAMSGTSRRWTFWKRECPFLLVFALLGCEAGEQVPPPEMLAECRTDADCNSEQRCEVDAPAARRLSIPMLAPCPVCATDTDCATGLVCRLASQQHMQGYGCGLTDKTCQVPCDEIGCGTGEVCRDSACVKVSCDEPDAPSCPERWSCDPGSSREQYADLNVGVAGSADSTVTWAEASHFIAIGCVRNLCDAPDGFTCGNGWTCAPDDPGSFGTGCFPTPCGEWGSCSSPNFVCEATNEFQRPADTDPHGCLSANCLENETVCGGEYSDGELSAPSQRCAPGEEGSTEFGCVFRNCEEITEFDICSDLETCSPNSPGANSIGCVSALCEKGDYECPEGGVCDPAHEAATIGGCVLPTTEPSAGGAETGGAGTGGPLGEAGANSGGATGTPAPSTGTASPGKDDMTSNGGGTTPSGGSPTGRRAVTEDPAEGGSDGDDPAGEADGDDSASEVMSEDTNGDSSDASAAGVVGRCVGR
jgi:hypothetical protein